MEKKLKDEFKEGELLYAIRILPYRCIFTERIVSVGREYGMTDSGRRYKRAKSEDLYLTKKEKSYGFDTNYIAFSTKEAAEDHVEKIRAFFAKG